MTYTSTRIRGAHAAPTIPQRVIAHDRQITASGVAFGAAVLSGVLPGLPPVVTNLGPPFGIGVAVFAVVFPFLTWGRTSESWDLRGPRIAGTGWLALGILAASSCLPLLHYAHVMAARQQAPYVDTSIYGASQNAAALAMFLVAVGIFRFPWRGSTRHQSARYALIAGITATGALLIFCIAGLIAVWVNVNI